MASDATSVLPTPACDTDGADATLESIYVEHAAPASWPAPRPDPRSVRSPRTSPARRSSASPSRSGPAGRRTIRRHGSIASARTLRSAAGAGRRSRRGPCRDCSTATWRPRRRTRWSSANATWPSGGSSRRSAAAIGPSSCWRRADMVRVRSPAWSARHRPRPARGCAVRAGASGSSSSCTTWWREVRPRRGRPAPAIRVGSAADGPSGFETTPSPRRLSSPRRGCSPRPGVHRARRRAGSARGDLRARRRRSGPAGGHRRRGGDREEPAGRGIQRPGRRFRGARAQRRLSAARHRRAALRALRRSVPDPRGRGRSRSTARAPRAEPGGARSADAGDPATTGSSGPDRTVGFVALAGRAREDRRRTDHACRPGFGLHRTSAGRRPRDAHRERRPVRPGPPVRARPRTPRTAGEVGAGGPRHRGPPVGGPVDPRSRRVPGPQPARRARADGRHHPDRRAGSGHCLSVVPRRAAAAGSRRPDRPWPVRTRRDRAVARGSARSRAGSHADGSDLGTQRWQSVLCRAGPGRDPRDGRGCRPGPLARRPAGQGRRRLGSGSGGAARRLGGRRPHRRRARWSRWPSCRPRPSAPPCARSSSARSSCPPAARPMRTSSSATPSSRKSSMASCSQASAPAATRVSLPPSSGAPPSTRQGGRPRARRRPPPSSPITGTRRAMCDGRFGRRSMPAAPPSEATPSSKRTGCIAGPSSCGTASRRPTATLARRPTAGPPTRRDPPRSIASTSWSGRPRRRS